LYATTIETAIRNGWAVPGDYVRLDDPNIQFVRNYNLWLEKRTSLKRSFGVDVFEKTIDVGEVAQFARVRSSWVEYCALVEEQYKQFRRAKRSFKLLERKVNKERDGVHR